MESILLCNQISCFLFLLHHFERPQIVFCKTKNHNSPVTSSFCREQLPLARPPGEKFLKITLHSCGSDGEVTYAKLN